MNDPTPLMPPPGTPGPWRVLILDRSPDDPKWIIATVVSEGDVRPAVLDESGSYDWADVVEWAENVIGNPVSLTPMHDSFTPTHDPLVWAIRPGKFRLLRWRGGDDA